MHGKAQRIARPMNRATLPHAKSIISSCKYEVSTFIHYNDDEKCNNWGGCGLRGPQGHRQYNHSIERIQLSI